jgi:anti-anti-sigma regulatory factor
MDIRLRTLLAFVPLLLVVAAISVAMPLVNQRLTTLANEQQHAADRLVESQNIELLVLHQHETVNRFIQRGPSFLPLYNQSRQQIQEILGRWGNNTTASQEFEPVFASAYNDLVAVHEKIIATARRGQTAAADALFIRDATDRLDPVLTTIRSAQERDRQQLALLNAQVQDITQRAAVFLTVGVVSGVLIGLALVWLLILKIVRPIERLADDAVRYASGDVSGQFTPITEIKQLRRLRDSFQHLLDVTMQRQERLQHALTEMEQQMIREQRLRETVHALSIPIIPLQRHVLLLPLIGYLDRARAAEATKALLDAVSHNRAHTVVLDVTGLAAVDLAAANGLRDMIRAAQLLGCQAILAGVRSDQVVPLIDAGLDDREIRTAHDIPAVLGMMRS